MGRTPEQLSDLECIRDAALRYCRGVDRLDVDLMKSAYWPDAIDDHGVFVGSGSDFCELCMKGHDRYRSTSHCIFNHAIELERDDVHARGEIYHVAYLFRKDEDVLDTWHGRYLDAYEKRGGEWRILERVCVHEGSYSRVLANGLPMDASKFRQGGFDRPGRGRRLGP